jgi:CDP-glycerol glycerophosphotransferase (TagB/SpsB family)
VKSLLLKIFCSFASFFIPTTNRILLFGSWYGEKYGDNPRYFFEWLSASDKDVDCYWVTKNEQVYHDLKAKNLNVVLTSDIKTKWLHLRARAIFCNCSARTDLLGDYLNKKTIVFNLWHGTPIKKIGHDAIASTISSERLGLKRQTFLGKFSPSSFKIFVKAITEKETYYLAGSEKVAGILGSAMAVDSEHIIVNGYPKLDHLIASPKSIQPGSILYAPTYRGEYNSENDLLTTFGFNPQVINKWLKNNDKTLTIRLHPANDLPEYLLNALADMSCISVGGKNDLYEELTSYELVITDFSSLFFDAIAVNVKTVLAPFGLNEYINEDRQLYFMPNEIFPYKMADSWHSLLQLLPEYFLQELDLSLIKQRFYCEDKGVASEHLWHKVSEKINR